MSFRTARAQSWTENLVREFLTDEQWTWDSEASVQVLIRSVNAVTDKATPPKVREVFEQEKAAGRLVRSSAYAEPLQEFFTAHPEVRRTQADITMLERLCVQFGLEWSADSLETILYDSSNPVAHTDAYNQQQAVQDAAAAQAAQDVKDKAEITTTLLEWYATAQAPLYKDNKYAWRSVLKVEATRLANKSADELRSELAERTERRRIKGLSPQEYRAEVTISRAAGEQPVAQPKMTQALNQYEALPATYTTRGGLTVDMNRAGLIKVANTDIFAFREIVRRYGNVINDVLTGKV